MKIETLKKISLILLVGVICGACKKNSLATYSNEKDERSVYFPLAETTNTVTVSFGYAQSQVSDSLIAIPIRTIGAPVGADQSYKLDIGANSTMKAGTDYDILNPTTAIKAGLVADTLKIKLKRTQQIRSDSLFLYLELQPNEYFAQRYQTGKINGTSRTFTRLRIKLDDIAGPPPYWIAGHPALSIMTDYFGAYSTLKFQLWLTRYNLNAVDLMDPNWSKNNFSRIVAYSSGLKAYLQQMQLDKTPIYEANGTLMAMGRYAR
ncbi:DUF4843 domain-containing protein [Pedobacter sp. KR3-3]|uniref:DUF4843 domain-containing protein n=1 Tax=Pedobacter albus TaxID=3113905 RepID=A0ABU7I417_9SPHI|nr:DUF4843 domain-containing protein [Pedobacter sp. KR3-3]MEE1944202.1 DUF4843 domain-containing protein [Pedobacter sp. KR3-3]